MAPTAIRNCIGSERWKFTSRRIGNLETEKAWASPGEQRRAGDGIQVRLRSCDWCSPSSIVCKEARRDPWRPSRPRRCRHRRRRTRRRLCFSCREAFCSLYWRYGHQHRGQRRWCRFGWDRALCLSSSLAPFNAFPRSVPWIFVLESTWPEPRIAACTAVRWGGPFWLSRNSPADITTFRCVCCAVSVALCLLVEWARENESLRWQCMFKANCESRGPMEDESNWG